jgi:polyvinyl alcohol dehydrogenase (cytochrome)
MLGRRWGWWTAAAVLAVARSALLPSASPADPLSTAAPPPPPADAACDWPMYGQNLSRTFATACPSAVTTATVGRLVPAWTFRPPPDTGDQATVTASPVIADGVVYVGAWNGVMYALDAATGALRWEHATVPSSGATFGPIVSSAAVAEVRDGPDRRKVVLFGAGPRVYALDAATGAEVWVADLGSGVPDDPTEVESSPAVWNGTVYVGMDVHNQPGSRTGGNRGGLIALDARTGDVRWRHHPELAVDAPAAGCGGVWGSPVVDAVAARVYFGTANCPAVEEDASLPMEEVIALDARTGRALWTFRPHQPPDEDQDFGATPNLFVDADGRAILGAANKDGAYYALDPATGTLLWRTQVTDPAPGVGGFIGSPAVWGGDVFGATAIGTPPTYHSFDGRTGAVRWQAVAGPSYAASAVVNGVVLAASLDSTLKAFDARDGRLLWATPLLGPSSSGPAVAGDLVVVGAGTASSDLCAKGRPGSELCFLAFDTVLGQQGGVHAFRLPTAPPLLEDL